MWNQLGHLRGTNNTTIAEEHDGDLPTLHNLHASEHMFHVPTNSMFLGRQTNKVDALRALWTLALNTAMHCARNASQHHR